MACSVIIVWFFMQNPSVVTRFMPCILSIMVDEAAIQLAKTAEEKPPQVK